MIGIDEARETIEAAERFGFSGADFLARLGAARVAVACNGIGPEDMPDEWRRKLDRWLVLFRDPCREHDCRFTYDNDGTEAKFRAANDELRRNCLIMADAAYKWWDPMRYIWRHRGRVVAWACQEFGWDSWRRAYDRAKAQGIAPCNGQFPAGAGNAGELGWIRPRGYINN
ncbi:MAG: hypothetical protein J6V72_21855 [Kiritimatiellae bacterium]|nr:hypothetical protein [Kiritimatiellia bacterium]